MRRSTAALMFWTIVVALVGARISLHHEIALGTTAGRFVIALLGQ